MSAQELLITLQKIQADNIGVIDCHIETRKDMQTTQIIFNACDYGFDVNGKIDKRNRSKLYVHRFKWIDSNIDPNYKNELKVINDEIKLLIDKYE